MKKIVASVGLVALGASSLQAASTSLLTDPAKPWSISATLRGFYDDNINSAPDDLNLSDVQPGAKRDSWGYEISPAAMLNWNPGQTTLSLGYVFGYKYFENKPLGNTGHDDQTHSFNLALDHAFNPQWNLNVSDSFVIGQEPDILRAGNSFATFQRVSGDNMRNYGRIVLNGQITPLFGIETGYGNAWYDYDDTGGNQFAPSVGGVLNRIEHTPYIDTRWQLKPETVGVIGYQYRAIEYTADEVIGQEGNGDIVHSDIRDTTSHAIYAGADHTFRPDLTGSLRAGARFTQYENDPGMDDSVNPYVQASLRWAYVPDSYLEIGGSYDLSATDVLGVNANGVTADAKTGVAYANLRHRLLPSLYGTLTAQYQNSTLHGGAFDGDEENFYLFGLNLEYRFNRYFSAHAGYNYDNLDSDVGRSFDRNRVYLGVTASY